MRVLIVTEPGIDGVFRHVEGLIAELHNRQVTIDLAYSDRRAGKQLPDLIRRVEESGGRTLNLRVTNRPELRDLAALRALIRLVRATKPDIIHGHSNKAGALVRLLGMITGLGRRCFYTPHAYYGMTRDPDAAHTLFIYNFAERVLGRIGTTINISQDEAAFARSTLGIRPDRQFIAPNPVDAAAFAPADAAARAQARLRLGLPEDARLLGMVGRMCWQKDPETAYRAVALAIRRDPRLFFVHLGWGLWKDYLKDFADKLGFAHRFRFVCYQEQPSQFYQALDGLVISSRYEAGWPFVLLEALACNLPVIAATCPGLSDLGRAGLSHVWTFAPEDVLGAASGLAEWTATKDSPPRSCNHRDYMLEHFSPRRCYGAVAGGYEAALRASK